MVRLFLSGFMSTERPGAYISENIEANFQIDIIFINRPYIWSLNKYILPKKLLSVTQKQYCL